MPNSLILETMKSGGDTITPTELLQNILIL